MLTGGPSSQLLDVLSIPGVNLAALAPSFPWAVAGFVAVGLAAAIFNEGDRASANSH